jgi:hypothetical protein
MILTGEIRVERVANYCLSCNTAPFRFRYEILSNVNN